MMSESIQIKKTACAICSTCCPINAYVKDNKMISVEGNREFVGHEGKICAKGAAATQFLYHKERVLYPMKRIGERGSGEFQRISWEEAYTLVQERLNNIKKVYGGKSVVFYSGHPKWYRPAYLRLSNGFGTPNYCSESSVCYQAVVLAWKLLFGNHLCSADIKNAKTVLVWSSNPYYSNTPKSGWIRNAKENGTKLIVIDPRKSETAQKADIHLQLKPGTDGALALAIAHIIIKEGWYDIEFIEKYVEGFEEFKKHVEAFTPKWAEKITGVLEGQIYKVAKLYALHKPSAIYTSASPVVHNINGVQNYRAIFSLIALTGNYDIPGGNRVVPNPKAVMEEYEKVKRNDKEEGIGEDDFPVWFDLPCQEVQGVKLSDYILEEKPYQIQGIVAMGMNHRMWPQPQKMLEALRKVDFFVDVDMFMTDTAKYADLILPACTSFEREEVYVKGEYCYLSNKVVEPLGESKNDIQIIMELAKYLGVEDEILDLGYEKYMDYLLKPTGITVAMLRKNPNGMKAKYVVQPTNKSYEETGFDTKSGKIELYSSVLEKYQDRIGYAPLPRYYVFEEIFPIEKEKYPYLLNTGSRKPHLFHSRVYRLSWLKNIENNSVIEMHPLDGERLNVVEKEIVWLVTPVGRIKVSVHLNGIGLPGVIHMYHGNKETDINEVIDKNYLDPISGFPGYKSYFCRIEKVKEK